jgi:hypothetical protein
VLTRPLDAPRLLAVAGLASLNLAAGLWLSPRPARGGDLQQVVDWTIAWSAGANPYSAGSVVDYPPWALVVLWPLSALAPEWRQPLWRDFSGRLRRDQHAPLVRRHLEQRLHWSRLWAVYVWERWRESVREPVGSHRHP